MKRNDDFTPHELRLVNEIVNLPRWQRETLLPLMMAAQIAHRHHVSLWDFLKHAESAWRGTDPMDLPPKKERKSK